MGSFTAFGISFTFSFLTFGLFFVIFIVPLLRKMDYYRALMALLLVHCLRTVGMMVIIPAVVGEFQNPLPQEYAEAIAYGDFASAVLALLCVLLLHFGKMKNMLLVWVFSVVGVGDLVLALVNSLRYDATSYTIGASWFTLNYFVPILWITHVAIIYMLLKKKI